MSISTPSISKSLDVISNKKGIQLLPLDFKELFDAFSILTQNSFEVSSDLPYQIRFHSPKTAEFYNLNLLNAVSIFSNFFINISKEDADIQKQRFISSKLAFESQTDFSSDPYVFCLQVHKLICKESLNIILEIQNVDLLIQSNLIYSYLSRFTSLSRFENFKYILGPMFATGGTASIHYVAYKQDDSLATIAALKQPKSNFVSHNFILEGQTFDLTTNFESSLILKAYEVTNEFIIMQTGLNPQNFQDSLITYPSQTCIESFIEILDFIPCIWDKGFFYGDFKLQNIITYLNQDNSLETKLIDLTLNEFDRINLNNFARTPMYFFEFEDVCQEIKRLKLQNTDYSLILKKIAIAHDIKAISVSIKNILSILGLEETLTNHQNSLLMRSSQNIQQITKSISSDSTYENKFLRDFKKLLHDEIL